MVHGAFPLLVDIFVALAASFRIHEKVGGDDAAQIGLRGGWEKGRSGAAAFAAHGQGRGLRIADAAIRRWKYFAVEGHRRWQDEKNCEARGEGITEAQPCAALGRGAAPYVRE